MSWCKILLKTLYCLCLYASSNCSIQMTEHAKHFNQSHRNKFLIWALCFAHQNKIDFRGHNGPGQRSQDVSPWEVLPSAEVQYIYNRTFTY